MADTLSMQQNIYNLSILYVYVSLYSGKLVEDTCMWTCSPGWIVDTKPAWVTGKLDQHDRHWIIQD